MANEMNIRSRHFSGWQSAGSLAITLGAYVMASPTWHIAIFAWIWPAAALYFFRISRTRGSTWWFLSAMVAAVFLSMRDIIPFPRSILIALALLGSIRMTLLLLLDQWASRKISGFPGTLFFPCLFVSAEFLLSRTGGGVWWSIANAEVPFSWLVQLASVTGIWGISFMIYWFASVVVWSVARYREAKPWKFGMWGYALVLLIVLIYGAFRYEFPRRQNQRPVLVAGVTCPQIPFLETLYADFAGKKITIDPRSSVNSAVMGDIAKAEIPFIETGDTVRFRNAYHAMLQISDSLFFLSRQAAIRGARIITWSEADALVFPADEAALLGQGRAFAVRNRVYLLMALAILHTGHLVPGTKFLENEAVLIGPEGTVLNVFHKNNPVPMAEASLPGNGIIPVIGTPFGKLAISICYDADFPDQMRQLGRNQADMLLLPSGDWYAISPYHTYMAILRGIENGCSVIRQVSGGLSVATDYTGRIHASLDYFLPGTKAWTGEVPVGHVFTPYTVLGDALAYGCLAVSAAVLVMLFVEGWKRIRRRKEAVSGNLAGSS